MTEWAEAAHLPELSRLFTSTQPPYHPKSSQGFISKTPVSATERSGWMIGRFLGIGGVLLIILFIALYFHNQPANRYTASKIPILPYVDPEHTHPDWFLNTGLINKILGHERRDQRYDYQQSDPH